MDHDELRKFAQCLLALTAALRLLLLVPSPLAVMGPIEIYQRMPLFLNSVYQLIFLLTTFTPPCVSELSLKDKLFYNFHGHNFNGRDWFSYISQQQYLFWLNTGETPETFMHIVRQTAPRFFAITRGGNPRQRAREYKLSIVNRILLVFIWLRKYPHTDTLALMFDISPQTVSALLYQGINVLWHYFHSQVTWPSVREWDAMRNTWPRFPDAVGCIDVTPHEIQIPSTEPQRAFYDGHRHYHVLNTQMICDNSGHIRFLQAGFLGSIHDSQSYRLMVPLGPGQTLNIPQGVVFLADKGYPDIPPLLTPFRRVQIRRLGNRARRTAINFNRNLSRRRIKIEHIYKNLKDFKCVTGIWRHPRWLLPTVVELCTFLTESRISMFEQL